MLPVLVGVIVAVHLESVALKDTHVPENAPRGVAEPPLLNETVPTGVDRVPAATSLTSAVHVACRTTTIEAGHRFTTHDVFCLQKKNRLPVRIRGVPVSLIPGG